MDIPPILPVEPTAPPTKPLPPLIKRWRWWIHLLVIASYPLLIGVLALFFGESQGPALTSDAKGLLVVCLEQMILFGIFFGVLLLVVGVFTLESLQEYVTTNRPKVETIVDVPAMRQNPLYYWLTLTVVSFGFAGFREELWRVAVLAGLQKLWPGIFASRLGQFGAVAVAAIIFGFGHLGQGVLAVGMTAILGFGLGAIMVLHRSIWPAVIAHGMFDATSLALIPWVLEMLQQAQKTTGH